MTSLPQLIGLCEEQWDAAANHLRVGEFEVWLEYLGETELARYARELRQQSGADMNVQLATWLAATGQAPEPQLVVSPPLLNLGAVNNQTPYPVSLHVRNAGHGFLTGRIDSAVRWIVPQTSVFAGNDQSPMLWIYGNMLTPEQPAEGEVLVHSNGGEVRVPIKLRPSPAAAPARAARPPDWAAGALLFLAVAAGVWLVGQLAQRWDLPLAFDVTAWLDGGKGWQLLLVSTLVLTVAAMLGSIHQWERLANDAPLREWLGAAGWVLGATFLALLVASALLSLVKLPEALAVPYLIAFNNSALPPPLLVGALAALITASGWATRLRRTGRGTALFLFLLVLWLVLVLAGLLAGALAAGALDDALPKGLPEAGWSLVPLAGAALGAGIGALVARLVAGLGAKSSD